MVIMHKGPAWRLVVGASIALGCAAPRSQTASDPLPSWNDGPTKSSIIEFVQRVTTEGGPGFVPAEERIATFDNDGTLWSEQPVYFQALFALDRVKAMAPQHPEWQQSPAFKAAVAGDMQGLLATGEKGVMEVLLTAHAGMAAQDFAASVRDWLATAKHPKTGMPFTSMVFQPMLELLTYLRANGFKTFIVTGGGIDFVRVFAESVYGVPPEQVVGTTTNSTFEMVDGVPTIVKTAKIVLVDDKAGKPVGIYQHIGRRPIFAAGNSDGDQQMLEYTTIPRDANDTRPRLGLLVHHTDAAREWAYDRDSHIGTLDKALDAAPERGWLVVDMKNDWNRMYPGGDN
jgi:phosphoglycolate phosphatase-like HAD superfamily hydrolase